MGIAGSYCVLLQSFHTEVAMRPNHFVTPLQAILFCGIPLLVNAAPHPLPDTVTHAHTVFLDNQTGFNELQYTLVLELSKWGRYDIVDTREKADLILRLDSASHVRVVPEGEFPTAPTDTAMESDIPKGCTRIALVDPKSNAVLWSDAHKTENGKVKSGHLLDGLREAFEAYDKSRQQTHRSIAL
jgi:hypothetical protein